MMELQAEVRGGSCQAVGVDQTAQVPAE